MNLKPLDSRQLHNQLHHRPLRHQIPPQLRQHHNPHHLVQQQSKQLQHLPPPSTAAAAAATQEQPKQQAEYLYLHLQSLSLDHRMELCLPLKIGLDFFSL